MAPGLRVLALIPLLAGCGEVVYEREPETPAAQSLAQAPPILDSFWLTAAMNEANQPPPPPRARSISLGYVGDTPLTNGVMRDTPMPLPQQMEQQEQPRGCSCRLATATIER